MRTRKKQQVDKVPVAIRYKELKDGRKSIYLDTYKDGKRQYEFLKLYLLPEDSKKAKSENARTMREANSILQQRIEGICHNDAMEVADEGNPSHMLLQDWFYKCYQLQLERRAKKPRRIFDMAHIMAKFNPEVRLDEVDKQFCIDFINYLRTEHRKEDGGLLSPFTVYTHAGTFRTAINEAVRQGLIAENPWVRLDRQGERT